jgi:hypothetical protein
MDARISTLLYELPCSVYVPLVSIEMAEGSDDVNVTAVNGVNPVYVVWNTFGNAKLTAPPVAMICV